MKKIISSTLYRKYRPTSFQEILGQSEVVESLKKSIENKSISHAYLFSGSRGTGKTSIARIFATEIGTNLEDVYEIDAASNRGIDQIRELREAVNTLPLSSAYKVYIIDEVHMLTKDAFNALLKTLEEPPKHIIFILATTEKNKILDTVLSRCQVFDFKMAILDSLKELIKNVSKKEDKKIDNDSVEFIAKLGNGSFRDTLSHLQKIFAICDKNIEFKTIKNIFALSETELENNFLLALSDNNKQKALIVYLKILKKNLQIEIFIKNILEKVRINLLINNSEEFKTYYLEKIGSEKINFLKSLKFNSRHLKKILDLEDLISHSANSNIALEIFISEFFDV